MKPLALVLVFISSIFAFDAIDANSNNLYAEEWETYKVKYNKTYPSNKDGFRELLYIRNKFKVADHNRKYYEGKVNYTIKINKFSDLLPEEINQHKGFKRDPSKVNTEAPIFIPAHDDVEFPKSFDWRKEGAVTPVKNQAKCGSCWAFSATGALEGQHFRKTGKLVSLSEQNLMDCIIEDQGCLGGDYNDAFEYIKENKGIDTEESYPYLAKNESCHFNKSTVGATDKGHVNITPRNAEHLKKAVATIGPISVSMYADITFDSYNDGVYECKYSNEPNHAVLIVGYGTAKYEGDYWIVKNSWGKDFGMSGYMFITRDVSIDCGISGYASYPLV